MSYYIGTPSFCFENVLMDPLVFSVINISILFCFENVLMEISYCPQVLKAKGFNVQETFVLLTKYSSKFIQKFKHVFSPSFLY